MAIFLKLNSSYEMRVRFCTTLGTGETASVVQMNWRVGRAGELVGKRTVASLK